MEIERRFLVKNIPDNIENYEKQNITQGYISTSPVIRLRKNNDSFYLTCKGKGLLVRDEWETAITKEQFDTLWFKVDGNKINKTRYKIPLNNHVAELDIYLDHLDGLVTVEVEFATVEDSKIFIAPDWFYKELTLDERYTNAYLANVNPEEAKRLVLNYKLES